MSSLRGLSLLVVLCIASSLAAQTTGTLAGTVKQPDGSPLPGVTVEAKSPSVQGSRIATTDAGGVYRLPVLPPGEYTLTFTIEGFAPASRRNIVVALGREATVDLTMRLSQSAEITVSAQAPVIDTGSTTSGETLGQRAITALPTGRNYSTIAQVTPGVSSDANPSASNVTGVYGSTISVYGSSGAENAYFIDGVNTTNAEYGFQGKELNFEFIQEVEVKTGGYEAEYGRSTGGIINVITKSGGNELHGDVFGYNFNDSLQANSKAVVSTAGTTQGFTNRDYGLDVGGYILKDKLWFFGAYDRVKNSVGSSLTAGPAAGQVATSESHRSLGSGKLTYNVAANQSIFGTWLQDPRVDTGAINDANHSLNGDPLTYLGRQDFGGHDYALRYDGNFKSSWIATLQTSHHREKNSVGPASKAGDIIQYRDSTNDFFQTGGFGLIQNKSFERKFTGGSLERYYGRHDIKGGIEYEKETADVTKRMSGGQQVDVFPNPVDPSKPIYRHFYWTEPAAGLFQAPISELVAKPSHRNMTAYLQDKWTLTNVTVNAGIRWDRQQIIDAAGVTQIDMKKDYAPRLGVIWDPKGDHSEKFYASYGRYYEEIPMDLVIRSFSYERQPRIVNYSPTSVIPNPGAESDFGTPSAILGGFTEPADPNIKNQYLTEMVVGGERALTADFSVGAKGIYRNYGRVIEDFLCAQDGTYCIGNPGEGIMKNIYTLDYSTTYPAPKAKRTYKAVELDATKHFSNNWEAVASYIYSRLDGNYDGEYAPFTNVGADPNISAAYDYYDFFTNGSDLSKITNNGPLSNDRRNQFKLSGVYITPFHLSIGAAGYWRSGTPITRYGYSDAYGRYEFFLTNRGAEGRTPSNYDVDV
ncbi:MAG TPA: TonB-dependent receptor, partial [Thermoanaerobaculia bacterium]|nr:TonB-dependent receptor [Thermoanaerobaculia bacterium]